MSGISRRALLITVPPAWKRSPRSLHLLRHAAGVCRGTSSTSLFFCSDASAGHPSSPPLGSGGGTAHALYAYYLHTRFNSALPSHYDREEKHCSMIDGLRCRKSPTREEEEKEEKEEEEEVVVGVDGFMTWLRARETSLAVLHAGGRSRRLPAYSAMGKMLTPVTLSSSSSPLSASTDFYLLRDQCDLAAHSQQAIARASVGCLLFPVFVMCGDVMLQLPLHRSAAQRDGRPDSSVYHWLSAAMKTVANEPSAERSPLRVSSALARVMTPTPSPSAVLNEKEEEEKVVGAKDSHIPDVLCFGLPRPKRCGGSFPKRWSRHGVFACPRRGKRRTSAAAASPQCMRGVSQSGVPCPSVEVYDVVAVLSKPPADELQKWQRRRYGTRRARNDENDRKDEDDEENEMLLDVGLWFLSPRAVQRLMQHSRAAKGEASPEWRPFELFSDLLPQKKFLSWRSADADADAESPLRVSVCALPPETVFRHVGTNEDLLSLHGGDVFAHQSLLTAGSTLGVLAPPPLPAPRSPRLLKEETAKPPEAGHMKWVTVPLPPHALPSYYRETEKTGPMRTRCTASTSFSSPSSNSRQGEQGHAKDPKPKLLNLEEASLPSSTHHVWIDRSVLSAAFAARLTHHHILTGLPPNDWSWTLPAGGSVEVTPLVGSHRLVLRPYHVEDTFLGDVGCPDTTFLFAASVSAWLGSRQIPLRSIVSSQQRDQPLSEAHDIFNLRLFPTVQGASSAALIGQLLRWMVLEPPPPLAASARHTSLPSAEMRWRADELAEWQSLREIYLSSRRLSAREIQSEADVEAVMAYTSSLRVVRQSIDWCRAAALTHSSDLPLRESATSRRTPPQSMGRDEEERFTYRTTMSDLSSKKQCSSTDNDNYTEANDDDEDDSTTTSDCLYRSLDASAGSVRCHTDFDALAKRFVYDRVLPGLLTPLLHGIFAGRGSSTARTSIAVGSIERNAASLILRVLQYAGVDGGGAAEEGDLLLHSTTHNHNHINDINDNACDYALVESHDVELFKESLCDLAHNFLSSNAVSSTESTAPLLTVKKSAAPALLSKILRELVWASIRLPYVLASGAAQHFSTPKDIITMIMMKAAKCETPSALASEAGEADSLRCEAYYSPLIAAAESKGEGGVTVCSPARLDLCGGWTDTPPYSLWHGGSVINLAVHLDGTPPVEVRVYFYRNNSSYQRHNDAPCVRLRSIDQKETIFLRHRSDLLKYEDATFMASHGVRRATAISALALLVWLRLVGASSPSLVSREEYTVMLPHLLKGRCLAIDTRVRVPQGSGLGTSSILAGTVLQGLHRLFHSSLESGERGNLRHCATSLDTSAFHNMLRREESFAPPPPPASPMSMEQVGERCVMASSTVAVEQLLTTGGGWQDAYGGAFGSLKCLSSPPRRAVGSSGGPSTTLLVWPTSSDSGCTGQGSSSPHTAAVPCLGLPLVGVDMLPPAAFKHPRWASCHVLYYTGIQRTAKSILSEIVEDVCLQRRDTYAKLMAMRALTERMRRCLTEMDRCVHGRCPGGRPSEAAAWELWREYGSLLKESWALHKALDGGVTTPAIDLLLSRVDSLVGGAKLCGAGGGGYLYLAAKDTDAAARLRAVLRADGLPGGRVTPFEVSETGWTVEVG